MVHVVVFLLPPPLMGAAMGGRVVELVTATTARTPIRLGDCWRGVMLITTLIQCI